MTIDGKPHPHSFYRDSNEIRVVEAVAREGEGITIRSKIEKLLVLKSTGSAFHGFHRDEYTQLPETWDRILSTEIEAGWKWKTFKDLAEVKKVDFNSAWEKARNITMETFATDDSASVQATMYKMCDQILAAVPLVEAVDYALPNKHYFEIGKSFSFESRVHADIRQTSAGTRVSRTRASMPPSLRPSPTPTASSSAPSPASHRPSSRHLLIPYELTNFYCILASSCRFPGPICI
jgi:urate oxidase